MAKEKQETEEKSVGKTERKRIITVTVDMPTDELLDLNSKGNVTLVWDPFNFKELDEALVQKLTVGNMENYFKVRSSVEEKKKDEAARAMEDLAIMSPLEMRSDHRLKIRERRGWHQAWKSPGPEYDAAMAGPYKQVRLPTKEQLKDGYNIGEENGEIQKLLDAEGKVEAIAVECREDLYKEHLEAMSRRSVRQFSAIKGDFYSATEEINRAQKNRKARIIPYDDDGQRMD